MKTAAVWGASGFVGRHLAAALQQAGWQVRALVRDTSPAIAGIEVRKLPFSATPEEMRAALQGVSVAFHCAGNPADGDANLAEFVQATAQFAQAAAASGVSVLLQLSTVAVYGARPGATVTAATPPAPATSYARSRETAEIATKSAITNTRTHCVIVRVPMVIGPGMAADALRLFFRTLRHGAFFHPGPPQATLNCIGISRLCQLLIALAARPPAEAATVLQFADNVAWTAMAKTYGQQSGRTIRRVRVPRTLASLGARVFFRRNISEGLAAFAGTVTYADDASRLGLDAATIPNTTSDIETLARQSRQGT